MAELSTCTSTVNSYSELKSQRYYNFIEMVMEGENTAEDIHIACRLQMLSAVIVTIASPRWCKFIAPAV